MAHKPTVASVLAGWVVLSLCASSPADTVRVTTYADLVSAAVNAPASGRTITVARGTYYQSNVIWPVGKSNMTIQGETSNPNDTVLVGMGIDNSSQSHNIGIDSCPHFTLQNLTLKNSYYHAIQVNTNSHYPTIRNCILWDNGEAAVKSTSNGTSYSDYGLVENCRIGFTTNGHRSVVEGIDLIASKGWVIRNNSFINVTAVGSVAYGAFGKGNSQDTIIENNLFYNCDVAASFGDGGTGLQYFRDGDTSYEHQNGIIRNNVMVGGRDAAVYVAWSRNARIYNNLSYKQVLTFQARWSTTTASFRNNIAVVSPSNPGEPIVRWRESAADAGSSNNVYGSDSWFVAPAIAETGDFHLLPAASLAIDKGYALPADVPTDKDGVARPQGSGFDIGPYERIGNRPPTIDAGTDQPACEGQVVHLHAAAGDPDSDTLSYTWSQPAGLTVALGGGTTADASFTAPVVSTSAQAGLTFTCTVNDGKGGIASDSVNARVWMLGDINRDSSVDVVDLLTFADAWNSVKGDARYNALCDFNSDNSVDLVDLLALAGSWGRTLN